MPLNIFELQQGKWQSECRKILFLAVKQIQFPLSHTHTQAEPIYLVDSSKIFIMTVDKRRNKQYKERALG